MSDGPTKINAANEIRKFADKFRYLLAAADDLEKLGSLENAEQESAFRLEQLQKDIDAAKAAVAEATAEAGRITSEAEAAARKTRDEAEAVLTQARADAEAILSSARADGAAMVADAERRRQEIVDETAGLRGSRDAMRAEAAEAEKSLKESRAAIDALRRKLPA